MDNDEYSCPVNRKTNELQAMRNEINLLKQEINSLKAWARNLKLWAKTILMVFSVFSVLILGSQYVYTSRVEVLSSQIRDMQYEDHCLKKSQPQ